MIEALWSIVFETGDSALDGGVITFRDGKLTGGDRSYYYVGTYEIDGDTVSTAIDVVHYTGLKSPYFGLGDAVHLKAVGPVGEKRMTLAAHLAGDPAKTSTVRLRRRAELP